MKCCIIKRQQDELNPSATGRRFSVVLLSYVCFVFYFSLDAIREVRKYSDRSAVTETKLQPYVTDHLNMKMFRAQRNLYISGFAVFLWL